ncbi:MAG TPA: ABC transporter substrate-binding protein [Stellaceae bacterium]|nr:ABC transporter substrate-binding protein [Stellaceae bacterium]
MAADLVERAVDAIAATGDAAVLAAKRVTSTIPIVFFSGGDPVATGLVASFPWPGGNLAGIGVMVVELMQKRLELLSELVPQARVIALLLNPSDPNAERFIEDMQEAARPKRLQLQILKASTESGIDAPFASLVRLHADALVVAFFRWRELIVGLASRYAVPAIYPQREFCRCRRFDQLWAEHHCCRWRARNLHRKDSQRREARRSAGQAADQV